MENNTKQFIDVELVKALMKARSIDEAAMASRMRVTVQAVKRFLNGADQSRMSGDIFYKVAVALEVPIQIISHKL